MITVKLLSVSSGGEHICEAAAKTCTSNVTVNEISEYLGSESKLKTLAKVLEYGHYSVLEHLSFTFGVEGISRACSHQLVRHRIASFSQQSQRYVRNKKLHYLIPASIREKSDLQNTLTIKFMKICDEIEEFYNYLLSNDIPEEDARYILPNAATTRIIVTMNARELLHFFELRCCRKAQWEIREMAEKMLAIARDHSPLIFEKAGRPCLKGSCPEGQNSCGSKTNE